MAEFPKQRPFLRNTAAFLRELRPGVRVLPAAAPSLADAFEAGTRTLPRTPALNRRVTRVFRTIDEDILERPGRAPGVERLRLTVTSLRPTLAFVAPAQTVCNYATLFFRNAASHLSEGDANGTFQRFSIITPPQGPNNEGGPASAPANGPARDNYLHRNAYPNTAAPGQPRECEAGNETFRPGRQELSNVPGNQGTFTSGQKGINSQSEGGSE